MAASGRGGGSCIRAARVPGARVERIKLHVQPSRQHLLQARVRAGGRPLHGVNHKHGRPCAGRAAAAVTNAQTSVPGRRRSAGCVLCAADSPPAAARPAPARPAKTRAAGAFCARVSARASKRQTGALAASPASSVTGQAKAASSRSMPASRAAQHSCCPPLCTAVQKRRRLHRAAQAGRARRRKRPAPARGPPVRWPPACGGALKTEANSES